MAGAGWGLIQGSAHTSALEYELIDSAFVQNQLDRFPFVLIDDQSPKRKCTVNSAT